MTRPAHDPRRRGRRPAPRPEVLEGRHLMTAGPSTLGFEGVNAPATFDLSAASPTAPVAVLAAPPTAIDLGFATPFDPNQLSPFGDVLIESWDATNGDWSLDPSIIPPQLNPSPDGTALQVVPGIGLGPGLYRLVFPPTSSLNDGTTHQDAAGDEVVAEFQVARPQGVGLGDAVDLGTVGPTIQQAQAVLDLQDNPEAVRLYKLELAPGHTWRLGLEVDAQRDGGTMATALALFDANGNLITASTQGRPGLPDDPYLFAGLAAGTYYVGVSAAANVPGTPGGYNPADTTPGTGAAAQAGGQFTLDLVADPITGPTTLLAMQPDHADPLDPNPTGFTLLFSGTLRVGIHPTTLANAVTVVDQDGKAWPVMVSGYDEAQAKVSFLFSTPLPAGHYTVEQAAGGGLVDLGGQPVVAPGQPAGVLGSFDVGAAPARGPNDLGILLPQTSATLDAPLAAGQAATYRFVAPAGDTYTFASYRNAPEPFTVTILGPDGPILTQAVAAGASFALPRYLHAGAYQLVVAGQGAQAAQLLLGGQVAQAATVRLGIAAGAISDSVLLNGVGQGPALDLRLIAPTLPTPDAPGTGPNTTPTGTPPVATPPVATPAPPTTGAFGPAATPPGPAPGPEPSPGDGRAAAGGGAGAAGQASGTGAAVLLTTGGNPVGLPGAGAGQVGAVGPGGGGAGAALASSQAGIPQSLAASLGLDRHALDDGPDAAERRAEPAESADDRGPTDGAIVLVADRRAEAAAPAEDLHDAALADLGTGLELGWFGQVRDRVAALMASARDALPAPTAPAVAIRRLADAASGRTAEDAEREQVAHAGLASPLNLGLAAMLALHYRHRARRRPAGRAPASDPRRHPGPRPLHRPRARV